MTVRRRKRGSRAKLLSPYVPLRPIPNPVEVRSAI
jgi:hypothetical protein